MALPNESNPTSFPMVNGEGPREQDFVWRGIRECDKLRLDLELFFSGDAFVFKELMAGAWDRKNLAELQLLLQQKEKMFRQHADEIAVASRCLMEKIQDPGSHSMREFLESFRGVSQSVTNGSWSVEELRMFKKFLSDTMDRLHEEATGS